MSVPYVCLGCRSALTGTLQCACGVTYTRAQGIPQFLRPDYYWGEIAEGSLAEINMYAEEVGWRRAIDERLTGQTWRWQSIADPGRSHWAHLLDLGPESVALDIGCGMGQNTHSLAGLCGEVHAIDAVWERLRFTSIRCRQDGLENVHLACASVTDLPFPEASFDAIVLIGIVEWIAEFEREGDPHEVQVQVLDQVRRLLKPGGKVVVGIENRIGYRMFAGERDHNGLPFTSLMPRWMASVVNKRFAQGTFRSQTGSGQPYRTYTYSMGGYRRVMADAGFSDTAFFLPYPSYNLPNVLLPLNGDDTADRVITLRTTKRLVRDVVSWILARLGLLEQFLPHYLFVAANGGTAKALVRVPGRREGFRLLRSQYSAGTGRIVQTLAGKNGEKLVIKRADAPDAREALAREHTILSRITAHADALHGICRVPIPLTHHTAASPDRMTTETFLEGEPLPLVNNGVRWDAVEGLMRWLAELHQALNRALGEPLQHGDMSPLNLIGPVPYGVFDWELAGEHPPLYDAVTLLSGIIKASYIAANRRWAEKLREAWVSNNSDAYGIARALRVYTEAMGVAQEDVPEMVLACHRHRLDREETREATRRAVPGTFRNPWLQIVETAPGRIFPVWQLVTATHTMEE